MAPPPPPSTNVWIAASEGNLSLVQEFFEADSSLKPTSPDDNTYTPLHAAASYAHHDLLRWLLTHPRATPDDVNVADEDGDTPLFVVEDAATARLLIEEFSADAKHRNNEGLTAAATMHENGFDDAAEYVRSVTGEQLESVQEEDEDEDDDSASQSDDLQHDGETTKRYVDLLKEYTSCELSDALIKLKHPTGGHLPNISAVSPRARDGAVPNAPLCGQVYPVSMVASTDTSAPPKPAQHFVDGAPRGSVLVIQAPSQSENAVWGGLMTARAQHRGVKGVVIDGKCRDLSEQWESGFSIFAKGHSTLGQSPFVRPAAVGCALNFPRDDDASTPSSSSNPAFPRATLNPTDLILADVDGVVFVPRHLVLQAVELAKKGREVDELCMQDLKAGRSIDETFKDRRGK